MGRIIKNEDIDFYYISTAADVDLVVSTLKKESICVIDTEVRILYEEYGKVASWRDPHTSRVRFMQINTPGNLTPWVIDVLKIGLEECQPLIDQLMREDLIKLAWNFKFDLKVIRSTFGVWLPNSICVMVMMQRISICTGFKSGQMRGHSFKAAARDIFDIDLSKTEQSSDWSLEELSIDQLSYAALDVGAPKSSGMDSLILQLYYLFKEALETPPPHGYGVKFSLDLDLQVNQSLAKMEYRGMPINLQMLDTLMSEAKRQLQGHKLQLCKDLDLPVEQKVRMTKKGPEVEIVVAESISKLLNNPKALTIKVNERLQVLIGERLTNVQSDTLEKILEKLQADSKEAAEEADREDEEDTELEESYFLEECKFNIDLISNLLEYKKLVKLTGTNYAAMINVVTGRLHGGFSILGASTGRMSSGGKVGNGQESLNLQQLSTVAVKVEALPAKHQFVCYQDVR